MNTKHAATLTILLVLALGIVSAANLKSSAQSQGYHDTLFVRNISSAYDDGRLNILNNGNSIGTNNLANSWMLFGTQSNGLGIDSNEVTTRGSDLIIGTADNNDVLIRTNGNTRATIDNTGLDINGDLTVSGDAPRAWCPPAILNVLESSGDPNEWLFHNGCNFPSSGKVTIYDPGVCDGADLSRCRRVIASSTNADRLCSMYGYRRGNQNSAGASGDSYTTTGSTERPAYAISRDYINNYAEAFTFELQNSYNTVIESVTCNIP